jgi:hypothetical protein
MSTAKKIHRTPAERAAMREKMQQYITEKCDREHREGIYEMIRQRQEERAAREQKAAKSAKKRG